MRWCHDEQTLDELLNDPLIDMMMRADGVNREQLGSEMARIAEERNERVAAE